MVLFLRNPLAKINSLPSELAQLLAQPNMQIEIPTLPGRDIAVAAPHGLPPRDGLSTRAGQRRVLHDLANIELQAMELGVRTLHEFSFAPFEFRRELAAITLEEAEHLRLCLEALQDLGGSWGEFPVHLGLWQAVSAHDSLLDRVFIVHRYLEGSGLDSGEHLLRKLSGVVNPRLKKVVERILQDEVAHVEFGSRWFRQFCLQAQVDPQLFFVRHLDELRAKLPRSDRLAAHLRSRAGFTTEEMALLQSCVDTPTTSYLYQQTPSGFGQPSSGFEVSGG